MKAIPFLTNSDALLLDIDGTLLDIAPTPDGVVVPPELVVALTSLQTKLGSAVALITGRTIENADALFAPLKLPCAGVHGGAFRLTPDGAIEQREPLPLSFREGLARLFVGWDGVIVEDKGHAVAVHYRLVPQKGDEVAAKVGDFVQAHSEDVRVLHSRKTVEVMQKGFDKARVIDHFMRFAPFKGRRPVFLGDSLTDQPAIAYCRQVGGLGFQIGEEKDGFVNPAAVREWLGKMAKSDLT